jgi:hypothetical protein
MPARLEDSGALRDAMRGDVAEISLEATLEAVNTAVRITNRLFAEVADSPPPEASLDEWHLEGIINSVETRVEDAEGTGRRVVAEWTHPHTDKIELGVKPHEITGDPVLVWTSPETGETIFATKVDHPGIPAVGAIRTGFRRALRQHFNG